MPALSFAGASLVQPCSVSSSRSSNRTGGFPASGSRTGVTVGHTASGRTPSPGNRAASGTFGRIEVARHMPIARPLFLPTAFQNQGSFARPALPGFIATTSLSVTPGGRACPSRASRWRSHAATAGASRVALAFLLDMPSPLPRRNRGFRSLVPPAESEETCPPQRRPSPLSRRVGFRITLFEACSAFTHVTACRFAEPLKRPFDIEGFDSFVTSTAAPTASGWSDPLPGGTSTRENANTFSRRTE